MQNLVNTNVGFHCIACSEPYDRHALICEACLAEDAIVEDDAPETADVLPEKTRRRARPVKVISTKTLPRISTGRPAWDHVLGGGLIRPSSVMIHGPKGVGKSTTLLRIACFAAAAMKRKALYGSAEMTGGRLKQVGLRLGLGMNRLYVNDSGQWEDMHADIEELRPGVIVWDSVQRFQVDDELGISQLRKVIRGAIDLGNRVRAVSLFISQVNKDDEFAGDNSMGHDVDVVLELKKVGANLIEVSCPLKNRDAPTPLSATESLYEG